MQIQTIKMVVFATKEVHRFKNTMLQKTVSRVVFCYHYKKRHDFDFPTQENGKTIIIFNGRPYCFSSVSFSLLLLFFLLLDFSEMRGRISLKLIYLRENFSLTSWRHFRSEIWSIFLISLSSVFLKIRSRYRAEIFRDCSLVIFTLMLRISSI